MDTYRYKKTDIRRDFKMNLDVNNFEIGDSIINVDLDYILYRIDKWGYLYFKPHHGNPRKCGSQISIADLTKIILKQKFRVRYSRSKILRKILK